MFVTVVAQSLLQSTLCFQAPRSRASTDTDTVINPNDAAHVRTFDRLLRRVLEWLKEEEEGQQ